MSEIRKMFNEDHSIIHFPRFDGNNPTHIVRRSEGDIDARESATHTALNNAIGSVEHLANGAFALIAAPLVPVTFGTGGIMGIPQGIASGLVSFGMSILKAGIDIGQAAAAVGKGVAGVFTNDDGQ